MEYKIGTKFRPRTFRIIRSEMMKAGVARELGFSVEQYLKEDELGYIVSTEVNDKDVWFVSKSFIDKEYDLVSEGE